VIAYEPVWAIGTGLTASSDQIEEVHSFIRLLIEENFGINAAEEVHILYGGSMKPSNAHEIMSCPNVDGGLIGGASLHSHDFVELIQIAGK
jgi:triosephosphate isomerase